NLLLKDEIGNLLRVLGDADKAAIVRKSKSVEQCLRDAESHIRRIERIEQVAGSRIRVRVVLADRDACARLKGLCVTHIERVHSLRDRGRTCSGSREKWIADGSVGVIDATGDVQSRIKTETSSQSGKRGKNIRFGDQGVVARDGNVEIIFQRKRNGVLQAQIEFAVLHELLQVRRVGQIRHG